MTHKALILSYVRQANDAFREGNCVFANDAIARATGLVKNSPVRLSASVIRSVMRAHSTIGRRCGLVAPTYPSGPQRTPEGLMPPSYVPGMQPGYSPDGLLPPSFHGPSLSSVWFEVLPFIGMGLATLGLVIGGVTLYKAS